jgi:O-methyltransferase involved in polyketide biosynthesis
MMGVCTAEVDRLALACVADHRLEQVVVLGAGMDTRAWRLKVRTMCVGMLHSGPSEAC